MRSFPPTKAALPIESRSAWRSGEHFVNPPRYEIVLVGHDLPDQNGLDRKSRAEEANRCSAHDGSTRALIRGRRGKLTPQTVVFQVP
jgi:hypothetical protein